MPQTVSSACATGAATSSARAAIHATTTRRVLRRSLLLIEIPSSVPPQGDRTTRGGGAPQIALYALLSSPLSFGAWRLRPLTFARQNNGQDGVRVRARGT